MTLFDGSVGETYKIEHICGAVRARLSELGFNPGCEIKILNEQHTDMQNLHTEFSRALHYVKSGHMLMYHFFMCKYMHKDIAYAQYIQHTDMCIVFKQHADM